MDITFHDGVLRIALPKSISAANSVAVEEGLFAIEGVETAKELILDAEHLEYISSLGLRIMLKFKKQYKDIPLAVENASESVYEIFEITGFASLLNVKKK